MAEAVIDTTTVLSLLATLVTLIAAYLVSLRVLPRAAGLKLRVLFVWHLFDALIHFIFEGSYLYNCFFTHADGQPNPANFLNQSARGYGAAYGTSPTARLWQEYGKADRRWMFADLTTISLEILTVFAAGPLAAWICWLLGKGDRTGRVWFLCVVLATAELYGGNVTYTYSSDPTTSMSGISELATALLSPPPPQ
jgi:EXPERA (EXPanded EBP superfamily)